MRQPPDIANRGTTKRGRVGMIGGGLAPFGVVLDRLRGVNRPNDQPGRGYRPMLGANRPGNSQPGRG